MAKTKSFAEKMMKSMKPKEDFDNIKVIRATRAANGNVKYESRIVKVRRDANEKEVLGL